MEDHEIEFVSNQLDKYNACPLGVTQRQLVPSDVLTDILGKILALGVNNGPDMQVVQCLLQAIFLTEKNVLVEGMGVYRLNKGVNKWFKKIVPINAGSMSKIYKTSIIDRNIQAVIKLSTVDLPDYVVLREYLVGLVLNNLRYQVPNFLYTLGSFSCSKPTKKGEICTSNREFTNFILYEKIEGVTVAEAIGKHLIKVDDWYPIFVMILLALEVAQRECRLTHYDLHSGNVMLVKNMPDYEVILDGKIYNIIKPKYTPILIDFGFSSVFTDGNNVGISAAPETYNFMVPSFDMFLFLSASFAEFSMADDPDVQPIRDLFGLYSNAAETVHDMSTVEGQGAFTKFKTHLVKTPGDASQTPLDLVNVMFKVHKDKLRGKVQRKNRDKLCSVKYSSSIKNYNDILGANKQGIEQAVKMARECVATSDSFLLSKYQIQVISRYNKDLKSKLLDDDIKKINGKLTKQSIDYDIKELNKIFSSGVLDQGLIDHLVDTVLSVSIFDQTTAKNKAIKDVESITAFRDTISPYFDAYYTILELGLDKVMSKYKKWVEKFAASRVFSFYTQNSSKIIRLERWCQTLSGSIDQIMV